MNTYVNFAEIIHQAAGLLWTDGGENDEEGYLDFRVGVNSRDEHPSIMIGDVSYDQVHYRHCGCGCVPVPCTFEEATEAVNAALEEMQENTLENTY